MLGGGGDDVIAALGVELDHALDRQVVRLGGAAGEDDLARLARRSAPRSAPRAARPPPPPPSRTGGCGSPRCRSARRSTAASPPARADRPAWWRGCRGRRPWTRRDANGPGQCRPVGTRSAGLRPARAGWTQTLPLLTPMTGKSTKSKPDKDPSCSFVEIGVRGGWVRAIRRGAAAGSVSRIGRLTAAAGTEARAPASAGGAARRGAAGAGTRRCTSPRSRRSPRAVPGRRCGRRRRRPRGRGR